MKKIYEIEVDCANCAILCEIAANKVLGVKNTSIHFMTQKTTIEFTEDADEKAVIKAILKACRKIEPDFSIAL